MATTKVRSTYSLSPTSRERLAVLAAREGTSHTAVIERLVAKEFADDDGYVLRSAAFQGFMSNAMLMHLVVKLLGPEKVQEIVAHVEELAPQIYGPVPRRPFDTDMPLDADPRVQALFAAFTS